MTSMTIATSAHSTRSGVVNDAAVAPPRNPTNAWAAALTHRPRNTASL